MNPLSEIDAAYLAGLIDGEGCIAAYLRRPNPAKSEHHPRPVAALQLVMSRKDIIRWVQAVTGIGIVTYLQPRKAGHKGAWLWNVSTRPATDLLGRLLPYFRVKRQEAIYFLELTTLLAKGRPYYRCQPERQIELIGLIKAEKRRRA